MPKKKSTRPVAEFPFVIDGNDTEDFFKIAQALHYIRYIRNAVPGVKTRICKITPEELTVYVEWQEAGWQYKSSEYYRIGTNTMSDGVRYSNGRKFKPTFAEFIDDLQQKHVQQSTHESSSSESE